VKLSWSSRWGMMGQVGHYWGYLYATENSAKSKAISGGASGAMGIYYTH